MERDLKEIDYSDLFEESYDDLFDEAIGISDSEQVLNEKLNIHFDKFIQDDEKLWNFAKKSLNIASLKSFDAAYPEYKDLSRKEKIKLLQDDLEKLSKSDRQKFLKIIRNRYAELKEKYANRSLREKIFQYSTAILILIAGAPLPGPIWPVSLGIAVGPSFLPRITLLPIAKDEAMKILDKDETILKEFYIMEEEDNALLESLMSNDVRLWKFIKKSMHFVDMKSFDEAYPELCELSRHQKIKALQDTLDKLPENKKQELMKNVRATKAATSFTGRKAAGAGIGATPGVAVSASGVAVGSNIVKSATAMAASATTAEGALRAAIGGAVGSILGIAFAAATVLASIPLIIAGSITGAHLMAKRKLKVVTKQEAEKIINNDGILKEFYII